MAGADRVLLVQSNEEEELRVQHLVIRKRTWGSTGPCGTWQRATTGRTWQWRAEGRDSAQPAVEEVARVWRCDAGEGHQVRGAAVARKDHHCVQPQGCLALLRALPLPPLSPGRILPAVPPALPARPWLWTHGAITSWWPRRPLTSACTTCTWMETCLRCTCPQCSCAQ
ncbi:hypothetical protein CLOP_g9469 [Closterium sp. NIES-67]|nr:hypothetical protein CLOP_g9469 [Closterium sp. NIES-67]